MMKTLKILLGLVDAAQRDAAAGRWVADAYLSWHGSGPGVDLASIDQLEREDFDCMLQLLALRRGPSDEWCEAELEATADAMRKILANEMRISDGIAIVIASEIRQDFLEARAEDAARAGQRAV